MLTKRCFASFRMTTRARWAGRVMAASLSLASLACGSAASSAGADAGADARVDSAAADAGGACSPFLRSTEPCPAGCIAQMGAPVDVDAGCVGAPIQLGCVPAAQGCLAVIDCRLDPSSGAPYELGEDCLGGLPGAALCAGEDHGWAALPSCGAADAGARD
jgi:hypothetical protein